MKNPIKITFKTELFSALVLLVCWVASFYFYRHFPERVITHWGVDGQANGWSGRGFAAFFFPGLLTGMYLLFLALPMLDPKRERYEEFPRAYNIFRHSILVVMAVIYFIASLVNVGMKADVGMIIPAIIGVLFVVIGNYMSKLKMNWFMGIRTPWSLSSEAVWAKTHRFGGKAFIFGGLLIAASGLAPISARLPLFISAVIILSLGTILYSYLAYREEKKKIN
jgi:uncharacterized membrane protein